MDDGHQLQTKDIFYQLTLGVVKSLEKRPGICNVTLADMQPAERHKVVSWEQRNSCMLPDDLKRFYLTSDGLLLKWSITFDDQLHPVGHMEINKITNLTKLAGSKASSNTNTPSLVDVEWASDDDEQASSEVHAEPCKPHFDTRSRIFELDPCRGMAKVCLVYRNTKTGTPAQHPEIWLLDRALRWHFLSQTFSQYFRMMLMHLGLPQWQYAFTDIGLGPQAKHWFAMYSPLWMGLDSMTSSDEDKLVREDSITKGSPKNCSEPSLNKLDAGRVFKGKSDKKPKSSQSKKKSGSAGKPFSPGGASSKSNSQLPVGKLR